MRWTLGILTKLASASSLSLIAGAALLDMWSGGSASATTLPGYTIQGGACAAGEFTFCLAPPTVTHASYTSPADAPPGSADATDSAKFSSATSPRLSATATASGHARAVAGLLFTYYIELTGLSGPVPLTVNTEGSAGLNSQAFVIIKNASTFVPSYEAVTAHGSVAVVNGSIIESGTGTSFSRSDTVDLMEGVIYSVTMDAASDTLPDAAFPAQSASVDPYFQYPAGYSLDISSGVGNSPLSAAPLPATLPLWVFGLGAMGLLGWRRKLNNAAAIAAV
jgi:hypothetical protein